MFPIGYNVSLAGVNEVIAGGVASNTFAVPGVPSGTVVSNPILACAAYQLDERSPSQTDDFRSIAISVAPLPAAQGLALAESKTIF